MDSSDPDDNSDLLLIKRLQGGDDHALNELMGRYSTPLYHYIYRFVHNAEDAADLLEETFVKLYFQRDKYKPAAHNYITPNHLKLPRWNVKKTPPTSLYYLSKA